MNKQCSRIVGTLALVVTFVTDCFAADFSKKIPTGASFGEVLVIWGDPVEKVERSVKREVVWYYPDDAKVVFKDGKVRAWQTTKAIRTVQAEDQLAKSGSTTPAMAELSNETRDLVRDIAKEVPSGPDVPMPDAPPPAGGAAMGQPPLIPNQIPPGGRGAPPGVIPGEVVFDDSDED